MALGGNVLRQHVVEFIRGTGIVTDGVVDATSLNGPWSWQVPEGVAELMLDGCGAGGGGGGGFNSGTSRAGGGGGATGQILLRSPVSVIPGSTLTVAVGAGGVGEAPGVGSFGASDGGDTDIDGLLAGSAWANINQRDAPSTTRIRLVGGSQGVGGGASNGGEGGKPGTNRFGFGMDPGIGGSSNAATPSNPNDVTAASVYNIATSAAFGCRGAPGGGASTNGAVAGARGGRTHQGRYIFNWDDGFTASTFVGLGTTDGTISYGGGGRGGFSFLGLGGKGGDGGQPGQNATGFGAGGGGGGGGAAGGNGADGYVRFTYWSMD